MSSSLYEYKEVNRAALSDDDEDELAAGDESHSSSFATSRRRKRSKYASLAPIVAKTSTASLSLELDLPSVDNDIAQTVHSSSSSTTIIRKESKFEEARRLLAKEKPLMQSTTVQSSVGSGRQQEKEEVEAGLNLQRAREHSTRLKRLILSVEENASRKAAAAETNIERLAPLSIPAVYVPSHCPTPSSSAQLSDPIEIIDEEETSSSSSLITLRTVLSGHSWLWKVPRNNPFSSLKLKFAEVYSLNVKDILCFSFDGSGLLDQASPSSMDMEDDDMIEVKAINFPFP